MHFGSPETFRKAFNDLVPVFAQVGARTNVAFVGLGLLGAAVQLVRQHLVLAVEHLVAPEAVDGAMLGRGHEPRGGVGRHAGLRPLLERGDEGVLREVLRQSDVAHEPREAGDQLRRFDPPDRVDGAMSVRCGHAEKSTPSTRSGSSRTASAGIA